MKLQRTVFTATGRCRICGREPFPIRWYEIVKASAAERVTRGIDPSATQILLCDECADRIEEE